jgi:hypothetical protein
MYVYRVDEQLSEYEPHGGLAAALERSSVLEGCPMAVACLDGVAAAVLCPEAALPPWRLRAVDRAGLAVAGDQAEAPAR